MAGCPGAFDTNDACCMAPCNIWRGVSGQKTKQFTQLCQCQGRKVLESATDLSEIIVADWKLGEVDTQNPDFKDIIFILPVSCGVCNRFILHESKELVAEEVRRDKDRNKSKTQRGLHGTQKLCAVLFTRAMILIVQCDVGSLFKKLRI